MEGAITTHRQAGAASSLPRNVAVDLAQLLARHGRGSEAVEQTRTHPEGDTPYAASHGRVDTAALAPGAAEHNNAMRSRKFDNRLGPAAPSIIRMGCARA